METGKLGITGLSIAILAFALSLTQCTDLEGLDETPDKGLELSATESSGILFMREEEKLARDVYLYLYELYPLRPFLNISKSEQAHMDAMLYLIDTLGLEDPVGENPEGVFQNEELQELYDEPGSFQADHRRLVNIGVPDCLHPDFTGDACLELCLQMNQL